MSLTDPMLNRLRDDLEPVLVLADPREKLSAYHDMPYAIFHYNPEEEFALRKQITLLETRLTQRGKRLSRISLAQCLDDAMRSQRPLEDWFAAEREQGTDTIVETVHSALSEYAPLVDLVAAQMRWRARPGRNTGPPGRTMATQPRCANASRLRRCDSGAVPIPPPAHLPIRT